MKTCEHFLKQMEVKLEVISSYSQSIYQQKKLFERKRPIGI